MSREYTRVERICQHCHRPFLAILQNVKKGNGRFCSNPCKYQARRTPLADRFFERVGRKTRQGCILWAVPILDGGYGQIHDYGMEGRRPRLLSAHRVSYELMVGPVPDGLWVLHRCDNKACINPVHLFLGTRTDNVDDMVAKGRNVYGERSPGAKLTEAEVREIRQRYRRDGLSQPDLAKEYGVSRSLIGLVVRDQIWRHVVSAQDASSGT